MFKISYVDMYETHFPCILCLLCVEPVQVDIGDSSPSRVSLLLFYIIVIENSFLQLISVKCVS